MIFAGMGILKMDSFVTIMGSLTKLLSNSLLLLYILIAEIYSKNR